MNLGVSPSGDLLASPRSSRRFPEKSAFRLRRADANGDSGAFIFKLFGF
jgi:hypothetical protein